MNQNFLYRFMEGQQIDKYHLEKLIGAGGFGGVFRASEVFRDRAIRQLAVKVIAEDSQEQLNELITASNLEHDHLVRSYAVGESAIEINKSSIPVLYLAMELAESSLEAQLKQGKLSEATIRQVLQHTAEGLNYLHQQKQVHRDLKPGNVLWAKNRYKLSDFGLVRRLGTESYVKTANPTGTYAYMPPEAFKPTEQTPTTLPSEASNSTKKYQISTAWDIWSLGIMAVQMLGGKLPYDSEGVSEGHLIDQVMNAKLKLPPIPSQYQPLISGCLNPDRRSRWTAEQVLAFFQPQSIAVPATSRVSSNVSSNPTQTLRNYTEILPGGVELEMIAIPAGEFLMGSPAGEGNDDEHPQHRVRLKGFNMGKYLITQAQYQAVMGINPSRYQAVMGINRSRFKKGGNYPVDSVSWYDAVKFCQKLTEKTGKNYQLPSEAQWEYACRAGTQTKYYFGDNESQLEDYGWYHENSNYSTQPVGQKKPNQWGLYDMHGNVWEWCADAWHYNYEGAPADGSAWLENGYDNRSLLRGGSWGSGPDGCRSASRYHYIGAGRVYIDYFFGFRVVCGVSRTNLALYTF